MSINRTTPRDEVTKAYYDGWDDARTFYEGHTIVRAETIEECAAMLENSIKDRCTFAYAEVMRDAVRQLRSLKDKP